MKTVNLNSVTLSKNGTPVELMGVTRNKKMYSTTITLAEDSAFTFEPTDSMANKIDVELLKMHISIPLNTSVTNGYIIAGMVDDNGTLIDTYYMQYFGNTSASASKRPRSYSEFLLGRMFGNSNFITSDFGNMSAKVFQGDYIPLRKLRRLIFGFPLPKGTEIAISYMEEI